MVANAALDSPPDAPANENGPFEDYPEASWDRVMEVNVKGVFLCAQVFGAAMAAAGRGSIVNVGSIYGVVSPDQSLYEYRRQDGETFFKPVAYSVSKSALYNFTRYLAVYWGPKNVRANIVTFAGVFTNQDPRFLEAMRAKFRCAVGTRNAGEHGRAEDYLGAVVFLLARVVLHDRRRASGRRRLHGDVAMKLIPSLIGGEDVAGGAPRRVLNPHDGSEIARLALADAGVVDRAFAAARAAQAAWAATPAVKRGEILFNACALIEERAEELVAHRGRGSWQAAEGRARRNRRRHAVRALLRGRGPAPVRTHACRRTRRTNTR